MRNEDELFVERQLEQPPSMSLPDALRDRVMNAVQSELTIPPRVHRKVATNRSRNAVLVAGIALSIAIVVLVFSGADRGHRNDDIAQSIPQPAPSVETEPLPTVQDYRMALWSSPADLDSLFERPSFVPDRHVNSVNFRSKLLE